MTKVLWISRHKITEEQVNDLKRLYGEIVLSSYSETIESIDSIKALVDENDVIAAVLPSALLCELVNYAEGKCVIQSVSGRVKANTKIDLGDGILTENYIFTHLYWQRIKYMRMEVENYIINVK